MAVIILSLLLAVRVWADQLPVKSHQDNGEIELNLANQLPLKTHQDDIEIPNKSDSVVLADQLHVKTHQDNSEIPIESALDVWAVQLLVKSEEHLTREVFDKAGSGCEYPFEPVGNNCYFFSDEHRNFDGAINYCQSLGHGYDVTLAMLDYDGNGDQALLDTVLAKDKMFWVGGKTEDGVHWQWQDDRDIYLQAPFWYFEEPNEAQNKCMVAQVSSQTDHTKKSYLYDYGCAESLNFICQIGCPFEFRRIGKYCYFLSEEEGLAHVHWQDARDYCQSLSVPVGYHADLAVLDLSNRDSYHLMNKLIAGYEYSHTWVGAYAETDCDYKWIDGKNLPISSTYWYYIDPACGSQKFVVLYHYTSLNRTFLEDYPESFSHAFICQMFKDA